MLSVFRVSPGGGNVIQYEQNFLTQNMYLRSTLETCLINNAIHTCCCERIFFNIKS